MPLKTYIHGMEAYFLAEINHYGVFFFDPTSCAKAEPFRSLLRTRNLNLKTFFGLFGWVQNISQGHLCFDFGKAVKQK